MERTFIGRIPEKELMRKAVLSPDPELIAIVGRRRVGKTFLIKQVYQDRLIFEAIGVKKATKKEQLQDFAFRINKTFYEGWANLKPKNWLEAFHMLIMAQEKHHEQRI